MFGDLLTNEEWDFSLRALDALKDLPSAKELVARFASFKSQRNDPQMKDYLFEIRFAYELHRANLSFTNEFDADAGGTTIDFAIPGQPMWLIELVSSRETAAVKDAIKEEVIEPGVIMRSMELSSLSENPSHSEAAEMRTLQKKIGRKVWDNQKPVKFPLPNGNAHMILVDSRAFAGGTNPDFYHRLQMCYGPDEVRKPGREGWRVQTFRGTEVPGLFEKACDLDCAAHIQERIHFIGFANEREYRDGALFES